MRIAELDLSDVNKAAQDIRVLFDLGEKAHAEILEMSRSGKYKFPHTMGEVLTVDTKALLNGIASRNIRPFIIYDESNNIVGYCAWKIGSGIVNAGYKTASMASVYIPKDKRTSGFFVSNLFRYCAETLKREGFDTFIVANEGTLLDKFVQKMGLEVYAKDYKI